MIVEVIFRDRLTVLVGIVLSDAEADGTDRHRRPSGELLRPAGEVEVRSGERRPSRS